MPVLSQLPLRFMQLTLVGVFVLAIENPSAAQTATAAGSPTTSASVTTSNRPQWHELTTAQQQALSPLVQLWPSMTEPHKRKWLAVSQNFAQLSSDERATIQSRMREWAALTAQQRATARLNFANAQQLLQEDKRAKWEAYSALPDEAKQKLAAQQVKPVTGVAPAIKPVAAGKITTPPAGSSTKALPRIASDQSAPATLLPITATASSSDATLAPESTASPE
jgi:hypothetical protein